MEINIADAMTSLGKTESKEKKMKQRKNKKSTYRQKKRQQIIDYLILFWHHIMEYQKITNLPDTTFDNVPRFICKKWMEVHDQSGSAEDRYKPCKQIRFKTSMLISDLRD